LSDDDEKARPAHADEAERVDAADRDPVVAAVGRFARDVLVPAALTNDDDGVPACLVDSLRDLGALNYNAPPAHGGAGPNRTIDRRLHEHLAYGCLNTWLIWAQHAPIVGRITRDLSRGHDIGPLARRVLSGEVLAGAGISDVRRFPDGHLTAEAVPDGWVFRGTVSWVSGWGLNRVLLLAAVEETTSRVVTALVPVSDRTVPSPLRLKAVSGSHTVRLRVDGVAVPTSEVLSVEPLSAWHAADRVETSDARPHVFGLAARVLDELRAEASAAELVERWAPQVTEIRRRAYALAEEARAGEQLEHRIDERLGLKAAAADALVGLSEALLITRAGRGLAADDTAQLHARSALFLLVQGQTRSVRDVQLRRLADRAPGANVGS
jgi:alkylation response protein AidB-like acyl-CoA dehydrogenase